MTHAEQVLIRGKVFLYKQKAPFVPSGKSVLGALEYDETTDRVRCHECGEWRCHLGPHVSKSHGIDSREYRRRHGIASGSPISGIQTTARFSAAAQKRKAMGALKIGTREQMLRAVAASAETRRARKQSGEPPRLHAERRNENGTCQAQLMARIRSVADRVGRTPTRAELRSAGIDADSACLAFNVSSLGSVMSLAGLARNDCATGRRKYSRVILTEMLRDFYTRWGRLPAMPDFRIGLLPKHQNFHYHFGSMAAAYEAAGLAKVAQVAA
jgi:hypothetical protein